MRKGGGRKAKDWDCLLSLGEVGWYRTGGKLFSMSKLVVEIPVVSSFEPLIPLSCLLLQALVNHFHSLTRRTRPSRVIFVSTTPPTGGGSLGCFSPTNHT